MIAIKILVLRFRKAIGYIIITASLIITYGCTGEKHNGSYPYKDANRPIDERVADLVSRMTVDEKIRQLDMFWGKEVTRMTGHEALEYSETQITKMLDSTGAGSVHDLYPINADISNKIQRYAVEKTRLGIPILFIEEGLHGYSGKGSTSFPIPLQLSSAWDTTLVHDVGRAIATESRAHGIAMILGPVLCLPRDPRWGRVEETYGEDTYLCSRNGVAMVKGLQGNKLSDHDAVVAEPKHFAVHGIPEAGSNTSPVNIGEREARSAFLPVFEKAVREGGALGIMAAYSEIDGIPCVDNTRLLTDVLRKEWGFKGFVLSDLGAIRMSLENHTVANSISDALAQTLKAGLNMQFYDFGHDDFRNAIHEALKNNTLTTTDLDHAVSDILRVKFMLGLFENPYVDPALKNSVFGTDANKALALKAAQEGICLLKNENSILPIKKTGASVAVIGSLAASTYLGGYANAEDTGVSIYEGLKQRAGNTLRLSYAPGYNAADTVHPAVSYQKEAIALARRSDLIIAVVGEDPTVVGEGKDRADLSLDARQLDMLKALHATGKPVAAVLVNGRPLTIPWIAKNIPSLVESWFGGETGGLAVADVLLGNVNPSGKLPMTFPRSMGQVPLYYNQKPTSRHQYVDESSKPLFAFGHGLSYTQFTYNTMSITPAQISPTGTATVRVQITNTGTAEGTEVAQLYVRDVVSSVTTPVKALKGFARITLKPGENGTVEFKVGAEALALWNRQMEHVVEPGAFDIMVGSASDDIRQNGKLIVQ